MSTMWGKKASQGRNAVWLRLSSKQISGTYYSRILDISWNRQQNCLGLQFEVWWQFLYKTQPALRMDLTQWFPSVLCRWKAVAMAASLRKALCLQALVQQGRKSYMGSWVYPELGSRANPVAVRVCNDTFFFSIDLNLRTKLAPLVFVRIRITSSRHAGMGQWSGAIP